MLALVLGGLTPVQAQDAGALRARHAGLASQLADNPYGRPLALASNELGDQVEGDVHARLDGHFARIASSLEEAAQWCEILFLHLNVKSCRSLQGDSGEKIALVMGTKHDQPLSRAYSLDFNYTVVAREPDYLRLRLAADAGPLGTRDYRIEVEIVPLDSQRSFLHLSYSYRVGFAARMAMQAYLSTLGRDKVGFSEITRTQGGQPQLVGGTRGVVERNTMRYYLAIEAYLASLSQPPARQFEQRLAAWQTGVERYPRQLRELERAEYFALKRGQRRAQSAPPGG